MEIDYADNILVSLRRIIRSIDQHNKQLDRRYELTVPQVVCLRKLLSDGELSPGQLAKAIYLSQATVTGIIDRLEAKGLVTRERSTVDRRKILVRLTDRGTRTANDVPWPLQEGFSEKLNALDEAEKKQIDATLKQLVEMMETPALAYWVFGNDTTAAESGMIHPTE
ncbi:hypothetical protein DSCO28_38560 [Desulfosarcina ovata subsp. sediminis]|uniref:HTH marR-type domain-containing protein n=1 Tax=Desulfosarcina ovata subsp. sediminis TaxID=885957 RepID=A0A5K7ZSV7_9BACT|nr:MarR family transcriptional regulator [Desulfosarcina ovata]BBO83290.1 hypothetical protein DSCO28_38560 [Desulfosarcina ovata subsp. sediminis]